MIGDVHWMALIVVFGLVLACMALINQAYKYPLD